MLRVVVVASVLHAVVGFARVPQNQQESLESRTGATVECGEKVTKKCLAQKVDAMEVQLNRFLIEGPQHEMQVLVEQLQSQAQTVEARVNTYMIEGPHYAMMYSMQEQITELQTQVQQILRALGSSDIAEAWHLKPRFTSREQLKAAVDEWIKDETAAEEVHGPIADWDTSGVDDMSACCYDTSKGCKDTCDGFFASVIFNGDLHSFNGIISGWDTSKVTNMYGTLAGAGAFNMPLDWDTSSVTAMEFTFQDAKSFDQPLEWDTSQVTDFTGMVNEPPIARLAPPRGAR
jgi:hypothetical protein